jgi:hypothetical protein
MQTNQADLTVNAGAIIALRMFDIAYAIDLRQVETLAAAQARAASRIRLETTPPKAMTFDVPPVALVLDPLPLAIDGIDIRAEVTARLYDFGAVSFVLHVRVTNLSWPDFTRRVNAVARSLETAETIGIWDTLLTQVRTRLAPALIRPAASALQEDYLISVVHRFNQPLTAISLLDQIDLVPLLSGEQRPLSDAARTDLLKQQFSYYTDDLVVLTWDRAFIYEPRGDSDVIDVLEVANIQLLEMRYYDELLDDELPRMYSSVETARRRGMLLAPRRFANLARQFYTLVAEVTELTERVDNALQVTEDVYLARIYSSALDLFRVATVSAAVDRKLAIIRDTYTALYDEASGHRSELLEILILLLIVAEVVLAVVRP